MWKKLGILVGALWGGGVLLAPVAADAQSYNFTYFDVPGAQSTTAYGISDAGEIVGTFTDGDGIFQGFLYSNGNFTTFDVPGALDTWVYGINDNGDIVGDYYNLAADYDGGFRYSGGSFTNLNPSSQFNAYGINDNGETVGNINGSAVLDDDGTFSYLNYPPYGEGGGESAYGINNDGAIVGGYGNNSCLCTLGYLYSNGAFTDVYLPTAAYGINDSGEIVGSSFIYSDGTSTQFGDPGTQPYGINDDGDIVGTQNASDAPGPDASDCATVSGACSFLATPAGAAAVPEPGSLALLAPGVLGLLALRRARRVVKCERM